MQDYGNKRRDRRVDGENRLTITPLMQGSQSGASCRRTIQVLSKDISTGGLRVQLPDFLPVKTRLKVEITLSNPPRYSWTTGEIRWVRKAATSDLYEAGVEFDTCSPDLQRMLREYVAENS